MRANFTTLHVLYHHSCPGVGTSFAGRCAMEAQEIQSYSLRVPFQRV